MAGPRTHYGRRRRRAKPARIRLRARPRPVRPRSPPSPPPQSRPRPPAPCGCTVSHLWNDRRGSLKMPANGEPGPVLHCCRALDDPLEALRRRNLALQNPDPSTATTPTVTPLSPDWLSPLSGIPLRDLWSLCRFWTGVVDPPRYENPSAPRSITPTLLESKLVGWAAQSETKLVLYFRDRSRCRISTSPGAVLKLDPELSMALSQITWDRGLSVESVTLADRMVQGREQADTGISRAVRTQWQTCFGLRLQGMEKMGWVEASRKAGAEEGEEGEDLPGVVCVDGRGERCPVRRVPQMAALLLGYRPQLHEAMSRELREQQAPHKGVDLALRPKPGGDPAVYGAPTAESGRDDNPALGSSVTAPIVLDDSSSSNNGHEEEGEWAEAERLEESSVTRERINPQFSLPLRERPKTVRATENWVLL